MPYTVELTSAARRDNSKLEHAIADRIAEAIEGLEVDPRSRGCIKMAGRVPRYRVRVGTYRIVYSIDDHRQFVLVERIQHRREVYR
jgi:mRNA interferase RelE/StbE